MNTVKPQAKKAEKTQKASNHHPKPRRNKTYLQLIDIQDEINKIKHNQEVQQELTQTIATILQCINHNTTAPLYNHKPRERTKQEYAILANQNQHIPAPHHLFLFHTNIQREMHETLLQKIKHHQIQNTDQFTDELFHQIFYRPDYIPPLFQQHTQSQTLEKYLEPLYELYAQL
jgi:hypothetical protein